MTESIKKVDNVQKVENTKQVEFTFRFHLIIFLITNGLLLVINEMFTPLYLWVLYPFFGWFIGLSLHLSYLYSKKFRKSDKKALLGHFSTYLPTNLLLIVINYYNSGTIDWAIFPLLFWGVGLLFHAVVYWEYLANRPIVPPEQKKKKFPKSPPKRIADKLSSLKKRAQLMQTSEPSISNQEKAQEIPLKPVNIKQNISTPVKPKKKIVKEEVIDLNEAEEAELKKTESEMGIEEKEITCLVHKGPIEGTVYVCPKCKTHYCLNCVKALIEKGEKCWACESELKP